ncbi:MAG: DNA polymerase Y family protein [Rudaea sp.]
MLWACLYFSDLPLRAVFEDVELNGLCAVVDGPRQRQHIVMSTERAQKFGVRAGQPLAAARAICANVQARTRDVAAEQRLLKSLAAWAYRFSSQVSIAEPDALLIEIGASLNLFGGWPKLERRLRHALARIDYKPSIAAAPIPAAARVLAGHGDNYFIEHPDPMLSALDYIPIAKSGLSEKSVSLLYNVGLRTLRDVFALPRPELARRIGPSQIDLLDRMRGRVADLLTLYEPPPHFDNRVELDDRVEAWPPLLFPLRRLCNELSLFLTARDGGVQRCDIVLDHEDRTNTRVVIELLTPQREAKALYDLARSRLEHATITQPVCGIALVAKDLPELKPRHKDLFEPRREQGMDWPSLIERLRAHLGDTSVRGLSDVADHRPDRAWSFDDNSLTAPKRTPSTVTTLRPPRPIWLLHHEIPLRTASTRILAGPERIESGWWDGADMRRDYYIVQTGEGQRAWAYVAAGCLDGWMLHGWFA